MAELEAEIDSDYSRTDIVLFVALAGVVLLPSAAIAENTW